MHANKEYDLQALEEGLRKGTPIPEDQLQAICTDVKGIFSKEDNLVKLHAPLVVVGDIHGQFYDMLKLFDQAGPLPQNNYLFLGNYIDRGHHSVEVIELLFVLKLRYPAKITLLRGHHECVEISKIYGFLDEINKKYGNSNPHAWFTDVFNALPIGALIDDKVLALHAGLSPELNNLDQIRNLDRFGDVPHKGLITDILWSDPQEEIEGWEPSIRGAGFHFGSKPAKEFALNNKIELLVRSHQMIAEGYKYSFPEKNVLTIWSAPNYCYKSGNLGAYLKLDASLQREIVTFTQSDLSSEVVTPDDQPSSL